MHERFEKRIELGLPKIAAIERRGASRKAVAGTKLTCGAAVEVRVKLDAQGFPQLRWTKVESWREWARRSEGCYLLRSNDSTLTLLVIMKFFFTLKSTLQKKKADAFAPAR
jgi:hypothetical protein